MGRTPDSGVHVHGCFIRIDFRYRGVRCREQLKNLFPTLKSIEFAKAQRRAILKAIERGTFVYAEWFPDSPKVALFDGKARTDPTIGDRLDQWLKAKRRDVTPAVLNGYRKSIRYHLKPNFGNLSLGELTPSIVKVWIGELTVTNKTVNNVLVPLRGAMALAFDDELIDKDPMARVKGLAVEQDEPNPFTPDEMRKILAELKGQTANFFQVAFWTGLRTSALIALEWGDIDENVIRVKRARVGGEIKKPKTKAGTRDVKLLPPAIEALQDQRAFTYVEGKTVFHNPLTDRPWVNDKAVREVHWTPALRRAKVRYRVPYQTRHTYASMMLSAGENPMWVANQIGHADWGMIRKRYGRWIPDVNPDAGEKAAKLWSQNAVPKSQKIL